MSSIQKFFTSILPRSWAASMKAESRAWMARCPDCGTELSIWELGGIRWKAAGTPRRLMSCKPCGKSTWHQVYYKQP